MTSSDEDADRVGAHHRATVPARRRTARALAAGAAGVLVTAGLGWVTAAAVGLTGPSGDPVVDALPSFAPQVEPPHPTYGQVLDLGGAHADRARRSSTAAPSPAPGSTSAATPTPTRASRPGPERSSEPTAAAVPPVRQGDPCRAEGAAGVTKSGSAAVCTPAPGHGGLRWRRV